MAETFIIDPSTVDGSMVPTADADRGAPVAGLAAAAGSR